MTGPTLDDLRPFFATLYGGARDYVCVFSGVRRGDKLAEVHQDFYAWPATAVSIAGWLAREADDGREVYVCAHRLKAKLRKPEAAAAIDCLWVDGDTGTIPAGALAPTLEVETSPGRWQGFWRLTRPVTPAEAEALNRRLIALTGADDSGWDLTQLLRIPGTPNRKYDGAPTVTIAAHHPERVFDPDELARVLPPAPERPQRAERLERGDRDNADEPPVELAGWPLEVYRGQRPKMKPDIPGQIDRSSTLLKIGRVLYDAGMTRRGLVDALAERDRALGYAKFAGRADESEQYHRIVDALEAEGRNTRPQAQPTNGNRPRAAAMDDGLRLDELPADAPCDLRLGAALRTIVALETENGELRTEVRRLRDENTAIVNTAINPDLKAEAPTIIRTVMEVAHARRQGKVDDKGFVRVSTAALGDDFDNVDTPIRSRATVKRHLEKAARLGLIEREVRTGTATRIVRDKSGKPITDPATGRPQTVEAKTDLTWVKVTGESVADMLKPFAFFRAPATAAADDEPKTHGGDRRSKAFQANRKPCPDCGSTERKSYCGGCGCDITETVEAEERAFHDEIRRAQQAQTIPASASAFQDAAQESERLDRGRSLAFQDETRSHDDPEQAEFDVAWDSWRRTGGPPLDATTDVVYGARR